jgi:Protein of unknown function (DUF4235)
MFARSRPGHPLAMLRKVIWSGLYAGVGAVATLAARRVSSQIWRVATGEEPPTRR